MCTYIVSRFHLLYLYVLYPSLIYLICFSYLSLTEKCTLYLPTMIRDLFFLYGSINFLFSNLEASYWGIKVQVFNIFLANSWWIFLLYYYVLATFILNNTFFAQSILTSINTATFKIQYFEYFSKYFFPSFSSKVWVNLLRMWFL